jgi:twitching motility two-component system response regulator PilG
MVAGETESGSRERRDAMESRGVGASLERQLKVIVLDASPTTRKILEVILRREGHQVVCFDDPLEALRFLSRHGPADLLFLGIDLPKMDGFNVLKYLKGEARFHSMVSIAILSEQDGVLSRVKARLAGAQQVMLKPLVQQRIVAMVSGYRLSISDRRQVGEQRALSMTMVRRYPVGKRVRNPTPGMAGACSEG